MKHCLLLSLLIGSIISGNCFAQGSAVSSDSMMRYYGRLANSVSEQDKQLLETQLYQLLKSSNESDWLTARRFFYQLKKIKVADSIAKEDKQKFPLGQLVRDEKVDTIYKTKDPVQKEKLYWAWVKKFPPQKFGPNEQIVYDYARNAVSTAYAQEDNVKKALQFSNMITSPFWKGEGWAGTASVLVKKGHLKEASVLYRKAIALSYKYLNSNKNDMGARFAATGYIGYNVALGEILIQQKHYAEALKYIREAHDSSKTIRGGVNASYAKILMKLGRNQQAFDVIDESIKAGQATAEMKEELSTLYVKVKGSNQGYEEYLASVNRILVQKIRAEIAKQKINLPSADFTLTDVDGNKVSLSSLKGKTVVLDFWATWCGPCKRSFPAMKMAVERFRNDTNVKFLFIHTWEKEENATDSAKAYVVSHNYPFQVLMDLKNAEGVNPVVESYKVEGIPTKFVIDPKGNIRFRFTGFSGGDDAAVEEIAAMIDICKNS
jgi:thiol-disulfide isomerase/thioredoxin